LISLGCTVTTASVDADADAPKPDSKAADADTNEPAAKQARAPSPASELAECPKAAEGPVSYCTEDDKLAGSWSMVDKVRIPDDVEIIFNAEGSDTRQQSSLMIAVRGDELYIRHVTCGSCRRILGQGFVGHLSHMNAEQVAAMQATLGLGEDVELLDSGEKWASFARGEAGLAMLTEIVNIAEMRVGG
jgi:hypothetical protein